MADSNPIKLCECGCGQPTKLARQTDSKRGYAKGQPQKFARGHNYKKHGHTSRRSGHSRTYTTWAAILTRCQNEHSPDFAAYGGSGISVCQQWQNFENFLADMGERPPGTSLDRYPDNKGNYEPGNCRWASQSQQTRNTSQNHIIEHNGERRCATEWAEIFGLPAYIVIYRANRGDIPPRLFRPVGRYRRPPRTSSSAP
jgi:hypothetical protein